MQAGLEGLAFSSAESWKKVGEVDTCRAQKNEVNLKGGMESLQRVLEII